MKWGDLENVLQRVLQPIKNRLSLMIGRAILNVIDDSQGIQFVQLSALAGETLDKIPRMQNFGFTSNPPAGSEAIVLSLGGNRENMVVVATENRDSRFKSLAAGESAQYSADGASFALKTGKKAEMIVSKLKITGDSHELIQVLDDLVTAIINARTNTAIGPMPLLNPADPFDAIKTRLETFKE